MKGPRGYSQTARPNELEARVGLLYINNHLHDCSFLQNPHGKQTNSTDVNHPLGTIQSSGSVRPSSKWVFRFASFSLFLRGAAVFYDVDLSSALSLSCIE